MARGPQRRGAQCSCIGLRPALCTGIAAGLSFITPEITTALTETLA